MTDDFLSRFAAELKKTNGYAGTPEDLRYDTSLMQLGLDSLNLLELMFHVERNYGIHLEVPEAGPRQIQTVGDLRDLVERALGTPH